MRKIEAERRREWVGVCQCGFKSLSSLIYLYTFVFDSMSQRWYSNHPIIFNEFDLLSQLHVFDFTTQHDIIIFLKRVWYYNLLIMSLYYFCQKKNVFIIFDLMSRLNMIIIYFSLFLFLFCQAFLFTIFYYVIY